MSAWRAPEAEARRRRGLRVRVLRRDGLEEVEGVEEDGRRLAAAVEGGVEVRAVKYEAWGAVVVEEVEVEVVEVVVVEVFFRVFSRLLPRNKVRERCRKMRGSAAKNFHLVSSKSD